MKIIKTFTILILFITAASAVSQPIQMKWLKQQPRTIAKDFYIWQYLNQNITSKQALEAVSQVRFLNTKIFHRFVKKYKDSSYNEYSYCLKAPTKKLITKPSYCIEAGLSVYEATKLHLDDLDKVIKKVKDEYPLFADKLNIINSPIPFKTLSLSENETFFNTFNECGGVYRVKYFNQYFPTKLLERLQKDKKFAQTIKLIVTNPKMKKAQKSLLNLDPESLNFKSVFHLAINAIRHKKEKKAENYLNDALKKAYYQMEKDNITFWLYKLTNDKKYLKQLDNSWDVNLYTLYAKEILNNRNENIIFNIKHSSTKKLNFDLSNPFKWIKVLSDTKRMDDKKMEKYESIFDHSLTLGHLAFVKERYHRYRKSYFITPYNDYIGKFENNRQALIYAIARQESRFIPTSISSAYAMGIMQIMPFLSRSIAKELKEPYNIYDQLKPETNLKYANHHLNYLQKRLKHPLFIAYGYNGGIGFTNRMLKQGLFKNGKYEPFLSMELLPYDETKKYGKKVLANYYIYQNHLNDKDKIDLITLLETIKPPQRY